MGSGEPEKEYIAHGLAGFIGSTESDDAGIEGDGRQLLKRAGKRRGYGGWSDQPRAITPTRCAPSRAAAALRLAIRPAHTNALRASRKNVSG